MAKGKYIARMDDDDISELDRFEKQFDYMEENPDITVVGSFINIIGNTNAKSWVCETESDIFGISHGIFKSALPSNCYDQKIILS